MRAGVKPAPGLSRVRCGTSARARPRPPAFAPRSRQGASAPQARLPAAADAPVGEPPPGARVGGRLPEQLPSPKDGRQPPALGLLRAELRAGGTGGPVSYLNKGQNSRGGGD